MDPEITLHELRELVAEAEQVQHLVATELAWTAEQAQQAKLAHLAVSLAEKFDALDTWLSKGGFAPAAWRGAEQEDHR